MDAITRRTGLTEAEVGLLIRCFHGVSLSKPAVPELKLGGVVFGRQYLLSPVRAEASNAHEDVARSGTWLETLDGNAEAPYQINDLIERLEEISDGQAEVLLYFIEGYYHAASR